MKKTVLCSALSVTLLIAGSGAQASTSEAKQGAIFTGGAVLGAIAGGPFGLIAGATVGALIGEDIKHGDQAKQENEESIKTIASLENTLAMNEALMEAQNKHQRDLELKFTDILSNLPGEVFFESNSDQLTQDGLAIIEVLAEVINYDPDTVVELIGHTDPRGTDEYNNVLSQYRAKAVADQLIELGVAEGRIASRGEGSNLSTAVKGDSEGYAFERRVDIVIRSQDTVALHP
ncbi:OmpA family protein [Halioxenophilus aromaticivorans]|uniref:OmpA-like domain-containing protein n=1 Tax=Halioxenophilus aromaticivorans TaxID=1306992 RepID=A0AAV3TXX7_9ALTE